MSHSSGSWTGARDIVDLDRFMRAARPENREDLRPCLTSSQRQVKQSQRIRRIAQTDLASLPQTTRLPRNAMMVDNGSSSSERAARDKRLSHDSGLSDGSYSRARHRPHRRCSRSGAGAFGAAWGRALREQQTQLARVTALCERLAERQRATSSSSRTTSDVHTTNEVKTYKIIMSKLDELNRLFTARARPSSSVSVSDKMVGPAASDEVKPKRPEGERLVERAVGEHLEPGPKEQTKLSSERWRRLSTVEPTPAVDIAPRISPNIRTDSVVKCESTATSSCTSQRQFDLDNPLHLYAQAKRLQAMHAHTARTRMPRTSPPSLCALCRVYVRALRDYLTAALCCPAQYV